MVTVVVSVSIHGPGTGGWIGITGGSSTFDVCSSAWWEVTPDFLDRAGAGIATTNQVHLTGWTSIARTSLNNLFLFVDRTTMGFLPPGQLIVVVARHLLGL